ncbi:phosphate acyltransferase PlsX [Proteiniclasticum sp. QWL-01]|nr:phosphate acyltransferase PlsX [Proteiniclasticum sp. QWL-01]UUM12700.1 phosphate acyltransferase PlsX [Clostridiaceae bacterium HFYG-1003]WFF74251.1 phosphate acyltransferase PlsX [Proteiniclasticum sp. QWL-01]
MRFAVDGMGGDHAPAEVVKGCVEAVKELGVDITITGPSDRIEAELAKYDVDRSKISVLHTTEVVGTDEGPVLAIRRKKDSSLRRAIELVRDGDCDGVVSAGSTGALLAGGLFIIGRIKGIDRPALAPLIPGKNGRFMVIDVGANTDCKPVNLHQFAHMGKVYFESILGYVKPRIGLVNIGAEAEKGNELTKAAYELLAGDPALNFVGNVEPRDCITGDVQVLVCDGFVGNTILKTFEGTVKTMLELIKASLMKSARGKLGGLLIKSSLKEMMKQYDYRETGGSAFLGLNGIVVKAHGSSDAMAFKNAIRQAARVKEAGFIDHFRAEIEKNQLQS